MRRVNQLILKHFHRSWVALLIPIAVVACGIPIGAGVPNDNKPTGTIAATGTLTGSSGKTASGNATVYNNNSSYILRLDGLSLPVEVGLQVVVTLESGAIAMRASLRASTGNQNYTIGSVTGTFAKVEIYSTSARTNYAAASLVSPGSGGS
jgi:hypothetical protein